MIFNYFEEEKKLLYFEHGADEIPNEIIAEFSEKDVTHVDFSSNSMVTLDCICHFSNLKEIIFDNNFLSNSTLFPAKTFPNIVLLSLNNNKFQDLNLLLHNLSRCFPNVRYLSLLGNPLCPALLQDFNENDHRSYRLSIISRMPKLRFLDAKSVDKIELLSLMQLNEVTNNHQSAPQHSRAKMDKLFRFFGLATKEVRPAGRSALTPIPDPRNEYSPLPIDGPATTQPAPKTVYCKLKNHYEGSQSQGNRFILNQDL